MKFAVMDLITAEFKCITFFPSMGVGNEKKEYFI